MSSTLPPALLSAAAAVFVAGRWMSRKEGFLRHIDAMRNTRDIDKWGYQVFSQHSEDGIIGVLAAQLGLQGAFVEFGFGIRQNNSLALALARDVPGLFMDGSERNCEATRRMLRLLGVNGVNVVDAWLDKDNIDLLIRKGTGGRSVDILSVDIDGVDYWILEAIRSITPAVIIAEYNASFGKDRAVTVEYDPAYDRMKRTSPLMHGMSLAAAAKLAKKKGYELIGCNVEGGNAFFVRNDLVGPYPVRSVDEAFRPLRSRLERLSQIEQERAALSEPLVDV